MNAPHEGTPTVSAPGHHPGSLVESVLGDEARVPSDANRDGDAQTPTGDAEGPQNGTQSRTTTDQLAAIEDRDEELGALCAPDCAGQDCQAERDRRALLALVREQAAKLGAVLELHKPVSIYELDENGHVDSDDESKFVRDICGTCSDSSVTENLDDGNYDIAGEWGEVAHPCPTIAALTATEGAQ